MSARIPTRWLGKSALASLRPRSTYWISPSRPFSSTFKKQDAEKEVPSKVADKKPDPNDPLANPILEKYLQKHDPKKQAERPPPKEGKMSNHPSTIFKPEYEIPGWRDDLTPEEQAALKEREKRRRMQIEEQQEYRLKQLKLDPAPAARRNFERRMVIKSLQKRGRVTKAVKLMRTERQSLYKSPTLPTSVKKLTKLMNQIKGKPVDEAMVQLRFSKKRVARDILKGLQIARDEAIAARGMSLGAFGEAQLQREGETSSATANEPFLPDGTRLTPKPGQPTLIELKDGSKKLVHDPTEMYIDQAWVGRGESWKSPEFRARGRINMLTHRTTSFSVLLKEEKTRMRISEEIKKKRENRKLWIPLPDRPVTSQRQYCLW